MRPIKIKVEVEVPIRRLADLLTCGLESGTYGSFYIVGYKQPLRYEFKTAYFRGENPLPETQAIFDATVTVKHIDYPLNPGGSITLQDKEDDKRYTLTLPKLIRGLQNMARHHPKVYAQFMGDNEDAITGNALIQLAVFGDIVYG